MAFFTTLFVSELLGPLAALAVLFISVGIFLLAWSGRTLNRKAVYFALFTGVAIAGYSFLSGLGIRKSQSLLGYIAWPEIATELEWCQ